MLAIRFQRVGRKGHAEFRVIVQEARKSPSSGRIVKQIGFYNPHTKVTVLDKEKASYYVNNGAQPSPRVTVLLQKEGVKLPSWVKVDTKKSSEIKNSDKLRRNRPAEEVSKEASAPVEPVAESESESESEVTTEENVVAEAPTDTAVAEEASTEVASTAEATTNIKTAE